MDGSIEVLKKAVSILDYMAKHDIPSGVSDLARALDMPKSTVHRILSTLNEANIVLKTGSGHYKMGPAVLLWSGGYQFSSGIVDLTRPWLEALRDETKETVHLSVYENGSAHYVGRLDSPQTVTLRWSRLGTELPLYCTAAGRAILSFLPQEELDAYLGKAKLAPRTEHTVVDEKELRKMLARFRGQGYAEENQENEENIRCVGVALLGRHGYPVAAISITVPSFRFDDRDAAKYGELLTKAAREISARL